jgi:hypothetical protein
MSFKHFKLDTVETYNEEKDSLLIEFPWGGNIGKLQREKLGEETTMIFRYNEAKRLVNIEIIGFSKVATPEGLAAFGIRAPAEETEPVDVAAPVSEPVDTPVSDATNETE